MDRPIREGARKMKTLEVTVECCLCEQQHKAAIELPEGWDARNDGIDEEQGFCPGHSSVGAFAESQCPGCVGGWTDCDLWRAFAYGAFDLTESEIATIRTGVCPRRTNGTMSMTVGSGHISEIDLSERAPEAAGAAFADAIMAWHARYHKPKA